jgi:phosphatidate cytidylyltransferase
LTGLVGAPLIFVIIFFGQQIGLLFLILAATGQGLIEFYRLALPEARLWEKVAGLGLGLLFPLVAYVGQGEMILGAMAIAVFVLLLLFIATPENLSDVIPRMAAMLLGILYVGFLLSHMVLLSQQPRGIYWVFLLIATVWAGDTCAYFTGTLMGKHKLYPRISPKKSVEGLLGGLAGSIVAALLFRRFFFGDLGLSHAIILAVFIMILGQIGDFAESMFKRSANVKDSSRLIPGHGGLLDRIDSFLLSAPFLYYCVRFISY